MTNPALSRVQVIQADITQEKESNMNSKERWEVIKKLSRSQRVDHYNNMAIHVLWVVSVILVVSHILANL